MPYDDFFLHSLISSKICPKLFWFLCGGCQQVVALLKFYGPFSNPSFILGQNDVNTECDVWICVFVDAFLINP